MAAIFLATVSGRSEELNRLTLPSQGSLRWELKDWLASPLYAWPRTLVSYPVDFSQPLSGDALVLAESGAGDLIPSQWSNIKKDPGGLWVSATLNFFTDLTPGARHVFELKPDPTRRAAPRPSSGLVSSAGATIEVTSDRLSVRLPKSQSFPRGAAAVPGPLLGLARDGRWLGNSQLLSAAKPVEQIETQEIESGPLFAIFRVRYRFHGGAHYEATVKVVAGYDHVEFSEKMTGLESNDNVRLDLAWNGFSPVKRFAANGWEAPKGSLGIDEPVLTDGIIEEPHWFPPQQIEHPEKEMIYHLAAYQGNAPRDAVPVMSFWEEGLQARELSIFVPDTLTWNDETYTVWQPSTALQIAFRHEAGVLHWIFPLSHGSRTTGIALHDVKEGEQKTSATIDRYLQAAKSPNAFKGPTMPVFGDLKLRYAQLLRSWYGSLSLNRVKDWSLEYPSDSRPPIPPIGDDPLQSRDSADALEFDVFHSIMAIYPLGLNLVAANISHRTVRGFVDRYSRIWSTFSPAARQRVNALFLLSAYVNAGEDLAPIRVTATGTPNMSADSYYVPAEISALFPDHPMGRSWREQFGKTVELQSFFYTRPDVPSWGANGGRWTESLAVYHWAYLLPTTSAQIRASSVDGVNRLANPSLVLRGRWLVDELTAPIYNPDPDWRAGTTARPAPIDARWHPGDPLDPALGFERQYAAHGAHSSGTGTVLPDTVALLGQVLERYDPLTSEHLLWAHAQVTSQHPGEWSSTPIQQHEVNQLKSNRGTPPLLKSTKYTGHGFILRAGVGTGEELSLHLDQVDAGPNYRWGNNGESSSGVLYFFARGQVWTGHETENTGDHTNNDTDGLTTFGVVKDHAYRSIGANELTSPLQDLGVAQFAAITARPDRQPFSWPQYTRRSVLLVGTDYFLLRDDAIGSGRFSWFTARDLPFPKLIFLDPTSARPDHWTETTTRMSHGITRDTAREASGHLVLVTHKGGAVEMEGMTSRPLTFPSLTPLRQYASTAKNAPGGVFRVRTPTSHDTVFSAGTPIKFSETSFRFDGTAGVIRRRTNGDTELALLSGRAIGADGVTLKILNSPEAAISAIFQPNGQNNPHLRGRFNAPHPATKLELITPEHASDAAFFIDGVRVKSEPIQRNAESVSMVDLTAGSHLWEFTNGLPQPVAPNITASVYEKNTATLFFDEVGSADNYLLEMSRDNGATWNEAGAAPTSPIRLENLTPGKKVHVRLFAQNTSQRSEVSEAYPVYASDAAPPPPDGLALKVAKNSVAVSWGRVLGVEHYRLYRRTRANQPEPGDWKLVYEGPTRAITDEAPGTVPPWLFPGQTDQDSGEAASLRFSVYDYAVSSVNGNGEGLKSNVASSDPSGWPVWWPRAIPAVFQRRTAYNQPPYAEEGSTPPKHYPAKE